MGKVMTKKADISVITATYNLLSNGREQKMLRCLNSIHEQTGCNIEHVVIDGGSTDGTLDFLRPYEEKGWIKVYSEADNGIYDAFNKGIKRATGEYVCFVNSDDYLSNSQGLSFSLKYLRSSQADFSYSPISYEKEGKEAFSDASTLDFRNIFYRMPCSHQGMIFKRSLYDRIGDHNQTYVICADYDFILRAILQGSVFVKVPMKYAVFSIEGYTGNHIDQLEREQAEILMKNYGCSMQKAEKIQRENYVPWRFYLKLLRTAKIQNKFQYIIRNWRNSPLRLKLKKLRNFFFKLRADKGIKKLKILGITIIDKGNK